MSAIAPTSPAAILERERALLALTLAAKQASLEAEAKPENLAAIVVADDADYAAVTEFRARVRANRDELIAIRQGAAQLLNKVATTIEEMFRPAIRAAEAIEADFRAKLEAYQVAKVKAEREAREAAAKAANAGDDGAMLEALTTSAALAQRTPDGGRVALRWTVKRITADLLPAEWWTPDVAKIEAVAKAHKGEEPPVIPGVVFEQVASVAVKR